MKIKRYVFEITCDVTSTVAAPDIKSAIEVFIVIYGESLLKSVTCIYEK